MSVDDLAGILGPQPGEDLRVVQGIIRAWNVSTFENEVEIDKVLRRNVRVGSGIEALTYAIGDVVLVQQWFPGGMKGELGGGTSWIIGRILTPGTGAAEQAIAFMQTTLARTLSRQILGQAIHTSTSTTIASFTTSSAGYVSHPDGTEFGAVVSDVEITETGRAWVIMGAGLGMTSSDDGGTGGACGIDITGATTVAPFGLNRGAAGLNMVSTNFSTGISNAYIHEGLNAGLHTFEVLYSATIVATTGTVTFVPTTLIVVPF